MTRKNKKAELFLNMLRLFLTVLVLSVIPTKVFAESARELHRQGVKLFNKEKYDEAAEKFKRAYALKPTWKILYNIGQCEAVSKRYGQALDAFEQYLVQGGDEVPVKRRDEISDEIRRIQPLVGILEVEAPAGTKVLVDKELRATLPTQKPIRVASGAHEVSLVQNGETSVVTVHVVGGIKTKVAAEDKQEPEPEPEPEPEKEPESEQSVEPDEAQPAPLEEESQKKHSWMWTTGWVGVGAGAAALISGAVTGGLTLSKSDELDEKCEEYETLCPPKYQPLQDEAETLALTTNILLVAGGVLAATGTVLLILEVSSKEKSTSEEARMTLLPEVGPGRMGLVLEGRF